ncbi:MAG: PilZ domain-containing protein [Bacteriovoracaceae bacterium]
MSQTFFSKLDPEEKHNRLAQLGKSKGKVIIWVKGDKAKHELSVQQFIKDQNSIVLDSKDDIYSSGTNVLCTFVTRGMTFFCKAIFKKSISENAVLEINEELFKSERRSSYRLLTYPIYEVWANFDLDQMSEGAKVISFKSKPGQTELFKNFIQLVENEDDPSQATKMKVRVQDLSATGMSIHVGEVESKFFVKDSVFLNVNIKFTDEVIEIPEVKVVYIVNYLSNEKSIRQYKVGLQFLNMNVALDHLISGKINKLLREIDSNNDFENFVK